MSIDLEPRTASRQIELFPETNELHALSRSASDSRRPKRFRRTIVALALASVGLIAGFAIARTTSDTTAGVFAVSDPALSGPTELSEVAIAAALAAPSVVQIETGTGLGSGVIYSPDGFILTAAHVIDGATTADIRLADGRLLIGTVIGTHTPTDVGVISIDAGNLSVAVLGYGTDTQVGETAIAVGSPFGLNQTVTAGIVSANGRNINGVPMIQTDAAINPGNSGGPLVNADGHVIGINDVIFTEGGGNDGIGFAIAIDVAIVVADQLIAGGDVELAALGVATVPDTTGNRGAIVSDLVPNSPAVLAGLSIGDRIISLGGDPVLDPGDLFAAVIAHRPGSSVAIDFTRDGIAFRVRATLTGVER
jgi:S1-C subfamily serine protease